MQFINQRNYSYYSFSDFLLKRISICVIISAMKKFEGYLICVDVDNTLTYKEGQISKENAEAIKYFQDEGGLFTLATGRGPSFLENFEGQLNINAPLVGYNGTLIYDVEKEEVIKKWKMDKDVVNKVLKYLYETYEDILYFSASVGIDVALKLEVRHHKSNNESFDEFFKGMPDKIFKVLSVQNRDLTLKAMNDLKEKFSDEANFYRSWSEGLEIVSLDSGKGIAVQYMKDHLEKNIHTTVGVGDYENDITLLEYADIGYAVGNAHESVKTVADKITVSNTEHAIAEVIKDLEKQLYV